MKETTEHETVGDVLAEMHSMDARNPYAGACARRIERAHARESAVPVAWMHEADDRVISARTKAVSLRDGGASASSVAPYSTPLYAAPPAPAVDEAMVVRALGLLPAAPQTTNTEWEKGYSDAMQLVRQEMPASLTAALQEPEA